MRDASDSVSFLTFVHALNTKSGTNRSYAYILSSLRKSWNYSWSSINDFIILFGYPFYFGFRV